MKTYRLPHTELEISRLAYGCMNLGGRWDRKPLEAAEIAHAARLVETACELGINFFDHADIYTLGKSEQVFGEVLRQQPGLRQRIIIQSKCGIRFAGDPQPGLPGRYDFSHTHIISSVEGSLKRLGTDHLDILRFLEQLSNPLSDDFIIVGEHYPRDRLRHLVSWSFY